jgi:coenzyme F420-0:L-glutamate ligase / coenzyme F420-1:gamma-L-glutamate ligase
VTPAAPSGRTAGRVLALGLPGMPEVAAGDDLAALLVRALERAEEPLLPGDVLVVSSKIVSKACGLTVRADDRAHAVEHQTVRVVAERTGPHGTTRIVHSRCGAVLAAAGVDASNVAPGTVLLLPQDPDALARRLRADLYRLTGRHPGVVISDTLGRPWRQGQVDQAIGAAGMRVLDDLRGTTDPRGNRLEVTLRAVADETAALADLVKGKIDGVPAALVRGLAPFVTGTDGPGAAELLRAGGGDWFRWGHVEAVRAALGVPPGAGGVRARPMDPGDAAQRLRRALEVARAGDRALAAGIEVRPAPRSATDEVGTGAAVVVSCPAPASPGSPASPDVPVAPGALVGLGRFCERVRVAGRSEDLQVDLEVLPGSPPRVFLRARTGREL